MANELTVSNLGDAVRDRVKSAIFASIPDEAIDRLIKNEFEKLTKSEYSNSKSELQAIIYNEIKKQVGDRAGIAVTKYLDENYISAPKEIVDKTIKELAPLFLAGLSEAFAGQAVQGLRNQLSQKGIYL